MPTMREHLKDACQYPTVVKCWLLQREYDGLFNGGHECACTTDDLIPCSEGCDDCLPGYEGPCDCGEHDFHIVPDNPELNQ
jgi:hypothetical protein